MWITEIRLKNYRAFTEEVVVRIPEGSHLLVYGENGSGKSSLFRGVKEFFAIAEDERAAEFMRNRWQEDEDDEVLGQIGIRLKENVFFQWLSDPIMRYHDIPFIEEVSRLSGFLSYKDFIPHYQASQKNRTSLFNYNKFLFTEIVEDLITSTTVPDLRTKGTETKFIDLLNFFRVNIPSLYQSHIEVVKKEKKRMGASDGNRPPDELNIATPWTEVVDLLPEFNDVYYEKIREINEKANVFLQKYFDSKITVNIQPGSFGLEVLDHLDEQYGQTKLSVLTYGEAKFVLFYAGKRLTDYRDFLNEARLSAFTLCFRLAAIRLLPAAADDFRVLFLDDIFTGLDMNNRLPLLRLIKEEFMEAEVAPFQVGIATHDRRWYELAKGWFEQRDVKIKAIEMYAGRSDDLQQPDEVVIIQEGLLYIEKARAYFKAKDYPSTANLLRKASEEKMRELLPKHKRLKIDDKTGLQKSETSLEILEKRLVRYLEDNDFDMSRLAPFGTFKKVVLNPLSHDDLEAPHYRSELEEAFKVVDYLLSIEVREVDFPQGKHIGEISMDFSYPDPENKKRRIKHSIIPREELRFMTVPDQGTKLMSCECRYQHDHEAEVVCADINSAIDLLWAKGGYDLPVDYDQAYNNLKISSRKSLADILKR